MMRGCENNVGWKMRTGLSVSVRRPGSVASSEIQRRGSCGSCAGEKNGLRSMWAKSANLLRPQDPSSTRSLLWRHTGVPGVRGAARGLPELRRREAGASAVVGQQPVLHQTVRLLCGAAMSVLDDPGCGSRTSPRLEDGQGAGDGVHARATATGRDTRPEGDRHRRTLHRQGTQLPDRRERPDPRPPDLVRRYGPIREEHGSLLPSGWDRGNARESAWP